MGVVAKSLASTQKLPQLHPRKEERAKLATVRQGDLVAVFAWVGAARATLRPLRGAHTENII